MILLSAVRQPKRHHTHHRFAKIGHFDSDINFEKLWAIDVRSMTAFITEGSDVAPKITFVECWPRSALRGRFQWIDATLQKRSI
jgi:hypothetical protein